MKIPYGISDFGQIRAEGFFYADKTPFLPVLEAAGKAMPGAPPVSAPTPEQLAQAKEEQLAALKKLRRWYNDWATTFRDVFGTRVQIRLGLTSLKRSAKEEEEDAAPKGLPQGGQ